MNNWINELVETYSEMETPLSFWRWAGLVAISAVMKDQIWLSRAGYYDLYPNIYCILYADSGMKKGPATNLAKKLVKEVNNTKLVSGRSSIQGILKKLQATSQSVQGGSIATSKSHGFIISSELSASLVSDPAALDILTDLYDRNYNADDWDSLLKMEEFKLRDPTITLFGGINAAHADSFFAKKDISGGFIARSFIIHEKEENKVNALVRRPDKRPDVKEQAKYLRELVKLKGPFVELADKDNQPTEVGEYYEAWYHLFRAELKGTKNKDATGTLNRYGDSILKVAMLLSLGKQPKLEIDLDSLKEAIELCEKFVGGVRVATQGKVSETPTNASRRLLFLHELLSEPTYCVSRVVLNKKYWMQGTSAEWDEAAIDFDSAKIITIETRGNQIFYQMTPEKAKEYIAFFKGRIKE